MVLIRKKPKSFEDVFRIIEESITRSLEEARRMFESFTIVEPTEAEFIPPMDLIDEGDKYILELDLPGVKKEDIQIYAYDHTLEIRASRKISKELREKNFVKMERAYSVYHRRITLPEDADTSKIKAKYENGVLRIEIGKREGYRRKIEVE